MLPIKVSENQIYIKIYPSLRLCAFAVKLVTNVLS